MTNAELWAGIALIALAGWGLSNWTLQRAFVPIANAFNILEKLGARQDDQIRETVQRIMDRRGGTLPPPKQSASRGQENNAGMEAINQVLGGNLLEPIDEQPDQSGVDIVE